jgi:hypothetical protein
MIPEELDIEGSGWTEQTILLKNRSKSKIFASVSNDSFVNSLFGLTNNQYHCLLPGKNESWYRVKGGLLMKLMDHDLVDSAQWHIQVNNVQPGDVVVYGAGGRDSYTIYSKQTGTSWTTAWLNLRLRQGIWRLGA